VPHFVDDFADRLARELRESRRELGRVRDRTEALATLHARALDLAASLNRPVTADDLFTSHGNEEERAALQTLARRVLQEEAADDFDLDDLSGNPAFDGTSTLGGHLDTGAGF